MAYAADDALVLEVKEPVLTLRGAYPSSLVRAVNVRVPLGHDGAVLVGAERAFGAEHYLPSGGDAPGGGEDVVVAVVLVEFRAFDGMVAVGEAVVDEHRVPDKARSVGRHLRDGNSGVESSAALGPAVDEVCLAVLVPEGAGVNQPLPGLYQHGGLPFAAGILGLYHIDSVVGVTPVDEVFAVVVADGRGPYAVAVARVVVVFGGFEGLDGVVDDFPVYEVAAVENRQPRHVAEAGGGQPVVAVDLDEVGVGIVGVDYRVLVLAVAEVGDPYLADVFRRVGGSGLLGSRGSLRGAERQGREHYGFENVGVHV